MTVYSLDFTAFHTICLNHDRNQWWLDVKPLLCIILAFDSTLFKTIHANKLDEFLNKLAVILFNSWAAQQVML